MNEILESELRMLGDERATRERFLRRLPEHFVYVAAREVRDDGMTELAMLVGDKDLKMILPIFTSGEKFASREIAGRARPHKIPFDKIVRQIRPDTGLVINPFGEPTILFPWWVMQECFEDIGADVIEQEVSEEWLSRINATFANDGIPPEKRPNLAFQAWSEANKGCGISWSSARGRAINSWFQQNARPEAALIGPLATVAFYFDVSFFEVAIPIVYGSPAIAPFDMVRMPASVKQRLADDLNTAYVFLKFFGDCFDYYYTFDDIRGRFRTSPLLDGFISSGREHITQAAGLLTGLRPNPKAAESSRLALEIFLKTFLVLRTGATENTLRTIGHRLGKLVEACLAVDPESDLRILTGFVDRYPPVGARYRADQIPLKELWDLYSYAQAAGATVLRPLSNRHFAEAIRLGSRSRLVRPRGNLDLRRDS